MCYRINSFLPVTRGIWQSVTDPCYIVRHFPCWKYLLQHQHTHAPSEIIDYIKLNVWVILWEPVRSVRYESNTLYTQRLWLSGTFTHRTWVWYLLAPTRDISGVRNSKRPKLLLHASKDTLCTLAYPVWYGILGFNIPLDTVQYRSFRRRGALSSYVHLPFSNGWPAT